MQTTNDLATTRREFLQQISLLGAASLIPLSFFSCSKDTAGIDYQGTGLAPYKVWEEMLMAIKTSPDFLEGRMVDLIKKGNPKEMLAFVRDEIYLMPPDSRSLRGLEKTMVSGIKGVLRSGFATPREKAELLSQMFNKAGFEAAVVYEETNFKEEEIRNFFFKPFERIFEPLVNQKILDRWQKELQVTPNKEQNFQIDVSERESKDLASHLFTFLPKAESGKLHKFNFNWDNRKTPCVKLKQELENKYAHLFDPSVPFGFLKEGAQAKTKNADPAVFTDKKIGIALSVSRGDIEEREIVRGEWLLHELIGNQLVVQFASGLNLFQQLTTSIGSLQTFTPLLALQSFSMKREELAANSYTGKTVTLQGDVIETENEEISINGIPLSIQPDKTLQKKVEKLDITAIPGKFPFVKFQISPEDEMGQMVEGLSASVFNIKVNDKSVTAFMQNNKKTPKVILMYDASLSMPKSYYGKNMTIFVNELEKQILENYPAANIQKWPTSSKLYTWLHKASSTDCDLIIFATDGDQNDENKPEWQATYQSGAPAIILNVKNSSRPHHLSTFESMAKSTNGLVINAENQTETKKRIVDYLKQLAIPPYVFTYNMPEKDLKNKVSVSIDSERIAAETQFEFSIFPGDATPLGSELSGIYLSISYDNKTTKKTLAGYDPIVHKSRTPNQRDFLDVRSLLLGGAFLSVEGQGPTIANRMADLLNYKLSSREWGEALLRNEIKDAREAYENGIYFYDDKMASLMQPLQNTVTNRSLTFATGPRIGIIKNKIGVGMPFSSVSFDYLQTSNFVTLAEDPQEAFRINMHKTAQMALLENRLFEETTLSLLKNQSLIEVQKAKEINWFRERFKDPVDEYFWKEIIFKGTSSYKIVDQSAKTKAFWEINKITGELYGMLSNDTAGGVQRIQQQLDEILKAMDTYLLLLGAMSARSGIPLAIVGGYGKTLVKLYAIASEALVVMDTSGMDEQIKIALAELACETYKTIVLGLYGNAGTAIGGIEYLIGMITGKSFCSLN